MKRECTVLVMNYDELLAPAAKAMRPSGIRKFFDLAADSPTASRWASGSRTLKRVVERPRCGIRSLELGRTSIRPTPA